MAIRGKISIGDIALKTGLSRATIDRVINNRPGVGRKSKETVENALADLGYFRLAAIQPIERKSVDIVLMDGSNPFFKEIRLGMSAALEGLGDRCDARVFGVDAYSPDLLAEKLEAIEDGVDCVITVGIDHGPVNAAIDRLEERGTRVITVFSDAPLSRRSTYVGQDNFAAGRAAGRLMLEITGGNAGEIVAMIGHLQFRHLIDRRSGFEQFISQNSRVNPVVFAEPYGGDVNAARDIAEAVHRDYPNLAGIYLCGGGQPPLFEAMGKMRAKKIAHEVTDFTRTAIFLGDLNLVIAQDVVEVAKTALNAALGNVDGKVFMPCRTNIYVKETFPPARTL